MTWPRSETVTRARRPILRKNNNGFLLSVLLLSSYSGDSLVEESPGEAEEKEFPPALRVAGATAPTTGHCRTARDVRDTRQTENTTPKTPHYC